MARCQKAEYPVATPDLKGLNIERGDKFEVFLLQIQMSE